MNEYPISEMEFIVLHAFALGRQSDLLTKSEGPRQYNYNRIEWLKTACGDVAGLIAGLEQRGLIANHSLTEKGLTALEPFKVDCAVIMAAGFSSRCVPLSLSRPKGLFNAKGQVLMERQIEQILSSGIPQIVVVVGYHKEQFYYLKEKYGVIIVENPEYEVRNNLSSLYHARKYLTGRRCYMCCADNWFSENVFDAYVYESYFAVRFAKESTDEFCIKEDPETGRCLSQHRGGFDQWYTMGQVFWDNEFSTRYMNLLVSEYNLPEVQDMLFDDFYIRHAEKFRPAVWKYPEGVIWEFDTIEDFCKFDCEFLEHNR